MLTDLERQADIEAENARQSFVGVKDWYASKSIWGAIFAGLAPILGFFGYQFGPEQIESWSVLFAAVGGAGGALFAAYGRIKANKALW